MKNETGSFTGTGGIELFAQWWLPEAPPKAVVAVIHGFGEHSGRYMNYVNHLVPAGYALFGFDHRGHGRSPGQRGHINEWSEYRQDTLAFLQMVQQHQPGLPIFMLGHSMGAMIGLDYLTYYAGSLDGAVISGSSFSTSGVSQLKVLLARLLSRLVPTFSMELGLRPVDISRNSEVVNAYTTDPLVHGKTTPRWGTEFMATMDSVKANANKITLPILFLHGGADPINALEPAKAFFETLPCPEKDFYVYPGSFHEPHNDLDYLQVMRDVEAWLDKRLGLAVE